MNMFLHGRDDFGIQKSGFLLKHTRNSFKPWKQYYFVLTRLCFICYHRGSNGIQGKNPKLKIDLSDIKKVEWNTDKKGKKKHLKQFSVHYNDKGVLMLKSETEELCREWVDALKDSTELCSTRKRVHLELRRASFKRNVEQNVRDKFDTQRCSLRSDHLPRVTYLNRTPWDERIRSIDRRSGNFTTKSFPPSQILLSPEKRCYTYNENIVLSTPDISVSQISDENKRNSLRLNQQNGNLRSIQEKSNHDLSKSFSSDDVRKLDLRMSWVFNNRRIAHRNSDSNQDDTDSGQGSEELCNCSDNLEVDDSRNIADGSLCSDTQLEPFNIGQGSSCIDGQLKLSKPGQGNSSLDSQSETSVQNELSKPSKFQWMNDDSPNYSNESEICFNGGYFSCNEKIRTEPKTYQIIDSSNRSNTISSNPNPTLSRSQRKWSSELDLVPEEKELGLFTPRTNSNTESMRTFSRDPVHQTARPYNSNNYAAHKIHQAEQFNDSNVDALRSQCSNMYRGLNKKPVLPRYNVPSDLHYQGNFGMDQEKYIDGYTYYNPERNLNDSTFGRQNKLYHSLDSTLSKHKIAQHPSYNLRDGNNYNHSNNHNVPGTAFHTTNIQRHSQNYSSNQFERVLSRLNNHQNKSRVSGRHQNGNQAEIQLSAYAQQRNIRNDPQKRVSYPNAMLVNSSNNKPNYRGSMYYNSDRARFRRTFHGYEEGETNFSGPDDTFDSESEITGRDNGRRHNGKTAVGKTNGEKDDLLNNSKYGDKVYFV